ncbi:MAG: copper homeostasis protein CutC [Anaerolineae bacterium]
MPIKVEICLDGADSAVAAQEGGADRVELCDNLIQGGTTPSLGLVELVRQKIDIDMMVMIRPRGGDFLYSDFEFAVMHQNIKRLHGLGVDGVVFGLLNSDGTVDRDRTAELIDLARPMQVTFHRAFDMSRDPFEALDTLLELGVERILTSGQAVSALAGIELIQELQKRAGDRLTIMPAVGVNAQTGPILVQDGGVRELHVGSAVKRRIPTGMVYQNHLVSMGGDGEQSEFDRLETSADLVRDFVTAVGRAV